MATNIKYKNFYILGLIFCVLGCADESVYSGGVGAFKDYDSLKSYRANTHYTNHTYTSFSGNVFENGDKNFSASNVPADSFSAKEVSLTTGMRESEAIQRATMKPYKVAGKWYYPSSVALGTKFDGIASWYGPNFHAKSTSNGERYNMHAHTAASKTLPMNTILKVYNKENGKTTIVRINDRGPFVKGRIIDLSNAAARDIGMISKGTANVRIEVIGFGGKVDKNYQNSLKVSSHTIQDEFKIGNTQDRIQGGSFALQVGAFKQKSGAQSTQESFKKKALFYNVFIKETQGIYRVFVGGFLSEEEAQDFAKSNNLTPIIVRE